MAARKQDALQRLVAQLFREREKHPHLTVVLLRQHWPAILGEELAARTYPARLSRDTLWINAADAGWAYQLQFMKADLLHSIHVFTESEAIQELRFRQGEVPWPAPGEEEEVDRGGTADSAEAGQAGEEEEGSPSAVAEEAAAAPGAGEAEPSAGKRAPVAKAEEATPELDAIGDVSLRRSFARWRSGRRRKRGAPGTPPAGS